MQNYHFKMMEDGNYAVMGYVGDEKEPVIPETHQGAKVTVLYDQLFEGHEEIITVHIPDCVTDLGEHVFDGCKNMHHLKLPADLLYFWGYTFVRCGLEEITIPDKVATIPSFAFKDCKQLKKVVCGSGLKRINAWAFAGCDKLDQLFYGPGVQLSPKLFEEKKLNT